MKTILIVDDQENWRDLLKKLFLKAGFCSICLTDPEEVLEKDIDMSKISVVISDLRFGNDSNNNFDGIDFIINCKKKYEVPIIVLSGYLSLGIIQKLERLKVDIIMSKVNNNFLFDYKGLVQIVRNFYR